MAQAQPGGTPGPRGLVSSKGELVWPSSGRGTGTAGLRLGIVSRAGRGRNSTGRRVRPQGVGARGRVCF